MKISIGSFFKKDRALGVTLGHGRYDLPLNKDEGTNFLRLLVTLMSFLTAMALIGTFALNQVAQKWSSGLENKMTIEIPAEKTDGEVRSNDEMQVLLKNTEILLKENKAVQSVKILKDADIKSLLEPWLGKDAPLDDIPLPGLVAVELSGSTPDLMDKLQLDLKSIDPAIVMDTHESWLEGLLRIVSSLRFVIFIVIGIIGFTTVTAIAGAIRSRIAVHRADLELLHLMGASDEYIVRQFQRHAFVLALQGGILGTFTALLLALIVKLWATHEENIVLPTLSVNLAHYILLAALPLAACLIATLTARFTVLRSLSLMP